MQVATHRREGQGDRGFSMVEMMIALSVLMIALLGAVPLVLNSNRLSAMVTEDHIARVAARQKLDEIRAADFSTITATYNGQSFPVDLDNDGQPELQPVAGQEDTGFVSIDSVPGLESCADTVRIGVVIRWRGRQGTHAYRLVTMWTRD